VSDDPLPRRKKNRFPKPDPNYASGDLFSTSAGLELGNSIERLYHAFEGCALDESFSGCPHCFTDDDVAYLRNTPLRDLSYGDAALLLPDSVYTVGSAKDLNYFLPRILETWAHHAHYMELTIPEKLELGRRAGWTNLQETAVRDFLRSFFQAANAVTPNTSYYYELSGELESKLGRLFPEIAKDLHIELCE
jgi:hypothetical protein